MDTTIISHDLRKSSFQCYFPSQPFHNCFNFGCCAMDNFVQSIKLTASKSSSYFTSPPLFGKPSMSATASAITEILPLPWSTSSEDSASKQSKKSQLARSAALFHKRSSAARRIPHHISSSSHLIRRHGFVQLDKPSSRSPVPGLLATKKSRACYQYLRKN